MRHRSCGPTFRGEGHWETMPFRAISKQAFDLEPPHRGAEGHPHVRRAFAGLVGEHLDHQIGAPFITLGVHPGKAGSELMKAAKGRTTRVLCRRIAECDPWTLGEQG